MEGSSSSLVNRLINAGYLKTRKIAEAFERTDRRLFVPKGMERYAYADEPLPIGGWQTISAPHMVAIMTELLEPRRKDVVLEVGTGSGYQAAVLSRLVKKVYTTEIDKGLVSFAKNNLKKAGIRNVEITMKDGYKGLEKNAPYDKITVTCAVPSIPSSLIEQLAAHGILLAPVGSGWVQELVRLVKTASGIERENHGGCAFVPLRKF